jgi:hypothetical protein
MDVVPIDIFAFVSHQAAVQSLEWSPVLHELRRPEDPPRQFTGPPRFTVILPPLFSRSNLSTSHT